MGYAQDSLLIKKYIIKVVLNCFEQSQLFLIRSVSALNLNRGCTVDKRGFKSIKFIYNPNLCSPARTAAQQAGLRLIPISATTLCFL